MEEIVFKALQEQYKSEIAALHAMLSGERIRRERAEDETRNLWKAFSLVRHAWGLADGVTECDGDGDTDSALSRSFNAAHDLVDRADETLGIVQLKSE